MLAFFLHPGRTSKCKSSIQNEFFWGFGRRASHPERAPRSRPQNIRRRGGQSEIVLDTCAVKKLNTREMRGAFCLSLWRWMIPALAFCIGNQCMMLGGGELHRDGAEVDFFMPAGSEPCNAASRDKWRSRRCLCQQSWGCVFTRFGRRYHYGCCSRKATLMAVPNFHCKSLVPQSGSVFVVARHESRRAFVRPN